MSDLLSAIGQGIGAVGGPLVTGGLNLVGGLLQQQGQANSVSQQEEFQSNMSNTAYQRSMADMTKAGLNPGLMYGSGGGESTPSGASVTSPNVLGGVASSAMDIAQAQKSMEVQDSNIALNRASAAKQINELPLSKFEGQAAATIQSILQGIETNVQNWGKTSASSDGVKAIFQSMTPNANNGPSIMDDLSAGLNPFDKNFMNPGPWKP